MDNKEPSLVQNASTDNVNLLLDKIDALEKRITSYDAKLKSITEFNRELLNRKDIKSESADEKYKEDCEKALENYINS